MSPVVWISMLIFRYFSTIANMKPKPHMLTEVIYLLSLYNLHTNKDLFQL